MVSKWQPETLGQYHDLWAKIILSAPDHFTNVRDGSLIADQKTELCDEFDRLRAGFHFARDRIKDDRLSGIAEELITMSLEAYLAGDTKAGAHALQECEGIIWPGRKLRVKYGVEAERRAFGANVLYADTVISPYPYEGTSADLGPDQSQLLHLAVRWCRSYQKQGCDFRYFSWVIESSGTVKRISLQPKEDDHQFLRPVQRSRGYNRLVELGHAGQIRACVLMEIIAPLGDGLVSYDLEEKGRPRVSARQLFRRMGDVMSYQDMRFHLEDPDIIVD